MQHTPMKPRCYICSNSKGKRRKKTVTRLKIVAEILYVARENELVDLFAHGFLRVFAVFGGLSSPVPCTLISYWHERCQDQ